MSDETRPPNVPPWERLGQFERTVVFAIGKMLDALDKDDDFADKVEELMPSVSPRLAEDAEDYDDEWAEDFNDVFDKVVMKACQSIYRGANGDVDKLFYHAVHEDGNEEN